MGSISKIKGSSIPFSIDLTDLGTFTSIKFEIYELSTFTAVLTYDYPAPATITKNGNTYSFTVDTSTLLGSYGIEFTWVKDGLTDKAQCGTITINVEAA